MTEGLAGIITLLEKRKTAISRALDALREVGGQARGAAPSAFATPGAPARKGSKRSPAVRKRMQEAQRLRWARTRGESEQPETREAKPKRRISAEGIQRIVAATKKRWALKRAEAKTALENTSAKKASRKKAIPAKAASKTSPVKKAAKKAPQPARVPKAAAALATE